MAKDRKAIKLVLALTLIGTVLIIFWLRANLSRFIFTSPYFNLREINISGQRLVKPEEILGYSRLELGANIFRLDIARISRMIAVHPLIKEAVIIRRLPDIIDIKVRERRQIAYIALGLGETYGLDEEGVILPPLEVKSELSPKLPVVTGLWVTSVTVGEGLDLVGVKSSLNVLKAMAETRLGEFLEIAEINVVKPATPVLYTAGENTEIRLGNYPLRQQLESLKVIWVDLKEKGSEAEYIDLRFGEKMVVKPREKR